MYSNMIVFVGKYRGEELRKFFPAGKKFFRSCRWPDRIDSALANGDWLYVVFEAAALRVPMGVVFCSRSWANTKRHLRQHRIASAASIPENQLAELSFEGNNPLAKPEQKPSGRVIRDVGDETHRGANSAWAKPGDEVFLISRKQPRYRKRKNFQKDYKKGMKK